MDRIVGDLVTGGRIRPISVPGSATPTYSVGPA